MAHDAFDKVEARHRSRKAYLYVRQVPSALQVLKPAAGSPVLHLLSPGLQTFSAQAPLMHTAFVVAQSTVGVQPVPPAVHTWTSLP